MLVWVIRFRDRHGYAWERAAASEEFKMAWFEATDEALLLDEIDDAIWLLQQHGYTVTASPPN